MIPITAIALLEYFLINTGSVKWLEYLPSITWPNWTFTLKVTDFKKYLTEILELAYLIPNAVPRITNNFCTPVLWEFPVRLQGSWVTLLAVVVIREIRTPWERFGLYIFCITNHWYALSWGLYFYIAVMLVDLDVTYRWRTYVHARPLIYDPLLISCIVLALAGPSTDLLTQLTGINNPKFEYSIHPDSASGLSISQAGHAQYPPYYNPRLNGLAFATALELSSALHEHFSLRPFKILFSHTFTIYLIHDFVVWSLGSWLCVTLSVHGLSYWANILVVAVCCYAAIALCLPLLTPLVET